ncbi:hypothetical protein [Shewanella algae]|uniref:hypothetical protein n=1 Tax=Shewanella algae TaxID=38313 RepID=UPI001AAD6A4F|nr:hypothetical protein [Shewanella algae]MBO2614689.1 hypothetical protein [Shewanella algae]
MSQTLFEKQASWRLQTKVTNGNFAVVTMSNLFNQAPVLSFQGRPFHGYPFQGQTKQPTGTAWYFLPLRSSRKRPITATGVLVWKG